MSDLPATHRAVLQTAPLTVEVTTLPTPKVKLPTDVVVKVEAAALCGSDLHVYRGHQKGLESGVVKRKPLKSSYLLAIIAKGHEFVGRVVAVGDDIKNFKVGDKVVSPFTISCGDCYFCKRHWTGRCTQAVLYGTSTLAGAQAEYIRVPIADSTLFSAPTDVPEELLVLMADIIPTGLFAAKSAWDILNTEEKSDAVVAVLGCGPVGLCAVTAAKQWFKTVYAIDSIPERLVLAEKHGAIPLNLLESPEKTLSSLPGGGPDAVLEIVGSPDALLLAVDLVRVAGVVISAGVHTKNVDWPAQKAYNKNLRVQFGRCPARAVFPQALELLKEVSKVGLFDNFIEATVPLSEAPKYYQLFNDRKIGKVVFRMD